MWEDIFSRELSVQDIFSYTCVIVHDFIIGLENAFIRERQSLATILKLLKTNNVACNHFTSNTSAPNKYIKSKKRNLRLLQQ